MIKITIQDCVHISCTGYNEVRRCLPTCDADVICEMISWLGFTPQPARMVTTTTREGVKYHVEYE